MDKRERLRVQKKVLWKGGRNRGWRVGQKVAGN